MANERFVAVSDIGLHPDGLRGPAPLRKLLSVLSVEHEVSVSGGALGMTQEEAQKEATDMTNEKYRAVDGKLRFSVGRVVNIKDRHGDLDFIF